MYNIINRYGIINTVIYNFNELDFLIKILLDAKIIIVLNYKKRFCMNQFDN